MRSCAKPKLVRLCRARKADTCSTSITVHWWQTAHAADALIVLKFRPGQFVFRGEPLAAIIPAG